MEMHAKIKMITVSV